MEFKEILLQKQLLDRLKNIEEAIKEINKKLDSINILVHLMKKIKKKSK